MMKTLAFLCLVIAAPSWAIVDKRHRCRRGFVVTGVEEVTID